MSQKRVRQVDLETGEVLADSFVAIISPKRKNGFKEGWCAMSNNAFEILEQFKSVEDFRVLMALMKRLDFANMILVNQSEIARSLDMQQPHVSRAIKRLIDTGIIVKGPKQGVSCSYQVNPTFGWKGSAKSHIDALDDARQVKKARMAKAGITGIVASDKPEK